MTTTCAIHHHTIALCPKPTLLLVMITHSGLYLLRDDDDQEVDDATIAGNPVGD